MNSEGERIAKLEVKVEHLTDLTEQQSKKIDMLVKAFDEARGGWKVLIGAAALTGFIAGKAGTILSWIGLAKP